MNGNDFFSRNIVKRKYDTKPIIHPEVQDTGAIYKVYSRSGKLIDFIGKNEIKSLNKEMWLKGVSCFVVLAGEKPQVWIKTGVSTLRSSSKKDLCSGYIENNETPTQAMIRELQEKFGVPIEKATNVVNISKESPLQVKSKNYDEISNLLMYFFYLNIDKNIEIKLNGNWKWVDLETAFEMIRNGETIFPKSHGIYETVFEKVTEIAYGKTVDEKKR